MDLRQQRNRSPERPVNRPVAAQGQQATSGPVNNRQNGIPKVWKIILGVLTVLILAGVIAYNVFGIGSPIDKSKYQAVFLTNGQVYFGKLSGWGGAQPELTDVYYFQATGGGEAEGGAEQPESNNSTQTLIKLGEEIHKPSDKLVFNKDSILFVENIEDDGQVVEAIKKNQEDE